MLPLLDLHGIKRLDFHNSVLEDLRDKLVAQIAELGNSSDPKEKDKKLRDLLSKSFPVIQVIYSFLARVKLQIKTFNIVNNN